MFSSFQQAGIFLISTLFDLYLFILVIRVLIAAVQASYVHPLCQFVFKVTQPIVAPIKKWVPNYMRLELASIFLIIVAEMIKFSFISLVAIGLPNMVGITLLAIADSLKLFLNILFYAVLLRAILSFMQGGYPLIVQLIAKITAPLLRPFQRIIPPIAGIDVSPIFALLFLQILIILLVQPLSNVGNLWIYK